MRTGIHWGWGGAWDSQYPTSIQVAHATGPGTTFWTVRFQTCTVPWSPWVPATWLVWIRMGCKSNIYTGFQRQYFKTVKSYLIFKLAACWNNIWGVLKVLVTQSCPTLCDPMDHSPPGFSGHGISQARNIGMGCHFLLQGIFLTHRSNSGLWHCRQILYRLSYQGSPLGQIGVHLLWKLILPVSVVSLGLLNSFICGSYYILLENTRLICMQINTDHLYFKHRIISGNL